MGPSRLGPRVMPRDRPQHGFQRMDRFHPFLSLMASAGPGWLLWPLMKPRLHISAALARMMNYRRFCGPARMLVLETGHFFERSWLRAGRALGWDVASAPSVMVGGLTRDQIEALFATLGEFKPDFILASNYAGMDLQGVFARFFTELCIPYVSWFTDTPTMILHNRSIHAAPYQVAATWERSYEPHLRQLGFEHVLFLPLATDPALFHGAPQLNPPRPAAFVGSSMIEKAAEARAKLTANPTLSAAIAAAFESGRVTAASLAQGLAYILPAEMVAGLDTGDQRRTELYLVYEGTRRQRLALVERLSPFGIEVRGDPHWAGITPRAAGLIGYFDDLAPYYRDTLVNVNATSLQMASAVNQRVFDCPAAGGFLLTDTQADLHELFDPCELATFGHWEELEHKTRYYLRHPHARIPIICAAQQRIRAHHTYQHRLATLECFLRNRFQT
jgi:spore maturation protein CgeB